MADEEPREPDELVEQINTGASASVDITRGSGTRDQEKWSFKGKGESAEEAMDELRKMLLDALPLADDVRKFQPEAGADPDDE